ncbi:hypothetical protein GW17_00010121 [Ensete ventricosum]|nr:hypothetical protein GW17_00010121 [Ensete ventricosum]
MKATRSLGTRSHTHLGHLEVRTWRVTSCWRGPRRRSYIPVFQIRMEKMKEVKRPPLERYPHDGCLQRNSSNLILQLLLRWREENMRLWLRL